MNFVFLLCYIPYMVFAVIVYLGLRFNNLFVIVAGLVFILFYNPKPEMEIISKYYIAKQIADFQEQKIK